MILEKKRAISPKSIKKIDKQITRLIETASFKDDISRQIIDMKALELMNEKKRIQSQLENIAREQVDWKESTLKIEPDFELSSKGQFIRKAKQELNVWSNKLSHLQTRAQKHRMYFGNEMDKKVMVLRERKKLLHHKLDEMRSASGRQLQHLKNQFETSMKKYRKDYREVTQIIQ